VIEMKKPEEIKKEITRNVDKEFKIFKDVVSQEVFEMIKHKAVHVAILARYDGRIDVLEGQIKKGKQK
jgi:hypothetical protein